MFADKRMHVGIAPGNILMVACHNFDLNAAQDAGFKTAFMRRPDEWGPAGPPDPQPNRTYDLGLQAVNSGFWVTDAVHEC